MSSIEWRGKNSCRLIVSCGFQGKKRIKKTRTVQVAGRTDAERKKAADKLLAEFIVEIERGLVIDGKKLTFKEFVERWLKDYAEIEPGAKDTVPLQGDPGQPHTALTGPSSSLTSSGRHTSSSLRTCSGKTGIRKDGKAGGLSEKTILQHHRIISSILNDAVEWQVIYSNPAARVKPPEGARRIQAKCYDEDQIADPSGTH